MAVIDDRYSEARRYIYTSDGVLRVASIGNKILTYDNLSMPKFSSIIENNSKDMLIRAKERHDDNIFHDNSYDGMSTAMTLSLFSCYGGVTAFVIPPIMLTAYAISELLYLPVAIPANIKSKNYNNNYNIIKTLE